jgi:DNA-binding transcriptional LysR family regulator
MSLAQLRYFVEVARLGSIRIAAERLNVAPSAISRQIQNLEDTNGIPFFERHARGVVLTQAGQIFDEYARFVLQELDRTRSDINDLKQLRRGTIRVHSVDGIVAGPLSTAICSFRAQHPNITFKLTSTGAQTVVKAVRDGESDVGIAFQPLPERNVLSAHEFADPLCVIAAPGSSMANLNQASLIEALRHPVALPTETFGIRALINARCAELKLLPEPALETNSIEALRGFARSGAGLTMLPYLSAKRDVDMGLLVALPFTDPPLRRAATHICVQERRRPPVAVREFVDHLAKTVRSWQESAPAVA